MKAITKIFLIRARTGCTCCSEENHYRGPYRTYEDAQRRIEYYLHLDSKYWPLASQYAKRGTYSIVELTVEEISEGRYIIDGDTVVSSIAFVAVGDDGTVDDDNKERFDEYD